jgi:hypothetical protein
MNLTTSLIGRKVIQGFSGEERGTIVAVFVDRGTPFIAVEIAPVQYATDGRTEISIEELGAGTLLAPVSETLTEGGTP